jgi:putative redox protein
MPQRIESHVEWLPDSANPTFRASNAAGNHILLGSAPAEPDAAAESAGWTGISPMEVVLLGLGGCTGVDVVSTLRKMRQDVTGYAIRVRGERRDQHPRVYTRIAVEHELRGRALRESAVRRAIALSAGRYCSVSAMLEQSAQLELTYRMVDDESAGEVTGSITIPVDLPPLSDATAE